MRVVVGVRYTFGFFFKDAATTEIYTLSLHDALPISDEVFDILMGSEVAPRKRFIQTRAKRSEEHTSELQSRGHLVCRLLLEKKKTVEDYPQCARQSLWSCRLRTASSLPSPSLRRTYT